MNPQELANEEHARDDLNWLAQKLAVVSQQEECYFCNTIREALARGWALMDARYYAIGKVMGIKQHRSFGAR